MRTLTLPGELVRTRTAIRSRRSTLLWLRLAFATLTCSVEACDALPWSASATGAMLSATSATAIAHTDPDNFANLVPPNAVPGARLARTSLCNQHEPRSRGRGWGHPHPGSGGSRRTLGGIPHG
jgi:hypothetical protein